MPTDRWTIEGLVLVDFGLCCLPGGGQRTAYCVQRHRPLAYWPAKYRYVYMVGRQTVCRASAAFSLWWSEMCEHLDAKCCYVECYYGNWLLLVMVGADKQGTKPAGRGIVRLFCLYCCTVHTHIFALFAGICKPTYLHTYACKFLLCCCCCCWVENKRVALSPHKTKVRHCHWHLVRECQSHPLAIRHCLWRFFTLLYKNSF